MLYAPISINDVTEYNLVPKLFLESVKFFIFKVVILYYWTLNNMKLNMY